MIEDILSLPQTGSLLFCANRYMFLMSSVRRISSSVMAQYVDVNLDHGRIVGVGESVLQGSILIYLEFIFYMNPGLQAIMKVHQLVYTGPLMDTSMKITDGFTQQAQSFHLPMRLLPPKDLSRN